MTKVTGVFVTIYRHPNVLDGELITSNSFRFELTSLNSGLPPDSLKET